MQSPAVPLSDGTGTECGECEAAGLTRRSPDTEGAHRELAPEACRGP